MAAGSCYILKIASTMARQGWINRLLRIGKVACVTLSNK